MPVLVEDDMLHMVVAVVILQKLKMCSVNGFFAHNFII